MDQEVKNQSLGKKLIVPLVAVALFAVLVFGATYAYFSASVTTTNNANLTATIPTTTTGFVTTSNTCNFDVDAARMVKNEVNETLASGMKNESVCYLTVTLTGAPGVKCTYNLAFQETSTEAYVPTDEEKMEFTGVITKTGDAVYEVPTETSMEKIITKSEGLKVVSNESITVPADATEMVDTYTLTQRWYNIDAIQDDHKGNTYSYELTVPQDSVVC